MSRASGLQDLDLLSGLDVVGGAESWVEVHPTMRGDRNGNGDSPPETGGGICRSTRSHVARESRRVTFSQTNTIETFTDPLRTKTTGAASSASCLSGSRIGGELVGGYVTIDDMLIEELTASDFEIVRPQIASVHDPSAKFRFERSARKSILRNLGIGGTPRARRESFVGREDTTSSSMDVYMKLPDNKCATIYTSCLVGMGALQLGHAMAKTGLIPGLLFLAMFGGIHRFLCYRLVEVPQLVEESFELYAGVAKVCFPSFLCRPIEVFCFLTWFSACFIYQRGTLVYIAKLFNSGGCPVELVVDKMGWNVVKSLCILVLIPIAWSTNVNMVAKCSNISWRVMRFAAIAEIIGALTFALVGPRQPTWDFDWVGGNISDGLQSMGFAYIGIGMLPYIVAEMVNSSHAEKAIDKACTNISVYYFVMGIVGYLGWGKTLLLKDSTPLDTMFNLATRGLSFDHRGLSAPGQTLVRIIWGCCGGFATCMFVVKAIMSFPLFLWPLVREVEGFAAWDETPASEVMLPWATKGQLGRRMLVKALLVMLMVPPLLLPCKYYHLVEDWLVYIPMAFTHLVLPATAAFVGIWKHWVIMDHRQSRELTILRIEKRGLGFFASMPDRSTRYYVGGSFQLHFFLAAFVFCIATAFWLVLVTQWSCETADIFSSSEYSACPWTNKFQGPCALKADQSSC